MFADLDQIQIIDTASNYFCLKRSFLFLNVFQWKLRSRREGGGREVMTNQGTIRAQRVVNACGMLKTIQAQWFKASK
jgi:hypothetical protein